MQQQQQYDTKLLYIAPVHVSTAVEQRLSMPPAKTYFKMDPESKSAQETNKDKQPAAKEDVIINPEVIQLNDEVLTNKYYSRKLNSMYRAKVMDAYYNRRIFVVYGYNNVLRRALIQRGWLEKLVPGRYDDIKNSSDEILTKYAREGNDYEAVAISKLIGDLPAFFVWQFRRQPNLYANVQPFRNVIRRNRNLDFTTKVGLIGCAEQEHWFYEPGVSAMSYPRFYRLGYNDEERQAFIDDFRRTQVFSLLRYVQEHHRKPNEIIDRDRGTVPFSLFKNTVMLVIKWMHDKEDVMTDNDWNEFISESNEIIRNEGKFKISIREFNEYIKTVVPIWRQLANSRTYNWDGCRNVWILKPGYLCRGSGIVLRDSLPAILEYTRINTARRYIAQKYIERPCLIYNTKFDIRQYMILSIGTEKIKIWLCKDCYLKFSSQQFKLNDLGESIHLTNNSVQKNYENDKSRDPRLPAKNMWSLAQFKSYLTSEGHAADKVWNTKVFEGFKQCVIAVVLASIEETELVPNTFEMYGVDFMLDEQFNPILIEVNATPDLSPSTEVTAHLCPLVIKDLVRVIVDVPRDKSASTGLFELVYEKNYHFNENYVVPNDMNVDGKAMVIHPMDYRKIPKGRNERIYGSFYARKAKSPPPERNEDGESYESTMLKNAAKKAKKGKKYKDPTQLALLKKIKSIHDGAETKKTSSTNRKLTKK